MPSCNGYRCQHIYSISQEKGYLKVDTIHLMSINKWDFSIDALCFSELFGRKISGYQHILM